MQDLLQGVSQLHILLRDDTPCNDTPCNDTLCNDTPATTHFIEAGTSGHILSSEVHPRDRPDP